MDRTSEHVSIHWAASEEDSYGRWACSNVQTECAFFRGGGRLVVINISGEEQTTQVSDAEKTAREITVPAHGIEIVET